jgi:hypothetical protein
MSVITGFTVRAMRYWWSEGGTVGVERENRKHKCGVKAEHGIPTAKECKEFNRKANEWLRKRGLRVGFDSLNYGKDDNEQASKD